jgi:hypothetical protein
MTRKMKSRKHSKRKAKKNFICNFRAPNKDCYREWTEWKDICKNTLHSDVCYLTLSSIRATKKAIKDGTAQTQIPTPVAVININQQNTFYYIVSRARRKTPIEGIPKCAVPQCKNPATNKLHNRNTKKDYILCQKHTDEYKIYADNITPLPQPDNIKFI